MKHLLLFTLFISGMSAFAQDIVQPEARTPRLARSLFPEQAQEAILGQAENNQFFRVLNSAFQDHPLPDFSVISQYLAPTGGVLFDRPTGLHYMTFSLKPESTR